jgi:proline iminopeptidase
VGSKHTTSEPYDWGLLATDDENRVYFEQRGNPQGEPVLIVHGGPGAGSPTGTPKAFDPEHYRVILFDQRGCGKSTPTAASPATSMEHNTTGHLLSDMERLRSHLGIERWVVLGGSWGSGLAVEYAERHSERVSGLVVISVWTMSTREIDWLYRGGVGQLFPAEWDRFRQFVAPGRRTGDVVRDYAELMESPDRDVRLQAAIEWAAWEDTAVSLEPQGKARPFSERDAESLLAFVRICSTYAANAAWRDEGALLEDAGRLSHVPGSIIHGRLDLSCPLTNAWELARAWPLANFVVVDDAGHKGSPTMSQAFQDAFAALRGSRRQG